MAQCERCGVEFTQKRYLMSHLKRKNVCPTTIKDISVEELLMNLTKKDYGDLAVACKYCEKQLANKYKYNKHLKICKLKPSSDEAIQKELDELRPLKTELSELKKEFMEFKKQVHDSQKAGDVITNNSTSHTDNSKHTTNIDKSITNNIHISFDSPSYKLSEWLMDKDPNMYIDGVVECIATGINGVLKLIDAQHFSAKYPEYRFVKADENGNLLCHIKNGKWQKRDEEEVSQKLVESAGDSINYTLNIEDDLEITQESIEQFMDVCGIALGFDEDKKFTHIGKEEKRTTQKYKLMKKIMSHIKAKAKEITEQC